MSDRAAFLDAILREPDEDTHRLVFADWLDEYGDRPCDQKRAKFIRLGCELARHRLTIANDQKHAIIGHRDEIGAWERLRQQVEDLWVCNEMEFLDSPWPLWEVGFQANSTWVPEAEWEFSRGFVSAISLSCAAFLEHAEAVFRRHPVTRVTLTDREPHGDGDGYFGWYGVKYNTGRNVTPYTDPADIPWEIVKRMRGSPRAVIRDELFPRWADFGGPDAEEVARRELSESCVWWGRKKAGPTTEKAVVR